MPSLQQIEQVFHEALQLQEGVDRVAWLAERCAGDEEFRAEVESLLTHQTLASQPVMDSPDRPDIATFPDEPIGVYRPLRLLGRGGTSTVYLAERTDQPSGKVALKVMSAHLSGEEFLRRFNAERRFLAALNHPNITAVVDAGISRHGNPYLVTEYVDGEPLDQYCDRHKLGIEARLRLAIQVCDAVDYAYRSLILHRDLKPANILVTADGVVKLLDFGTASLIAEGSAATTTRARMLTPRYASPEQLRGERPGITGDVFSLGVVVYELLTGAWPFGDPRSVVSELRRVTGESSTAEPSAVVTPDAAVLRDLPLEKLKRALDGSLSAIVLKALEHDPLRRYPTAGALAADLTRFLEGQPVEARPRTWLHRRRGWLCAAAVVVCIGAAVMAWRPVSHRETTASIAILPFTNLSSNPADRYLSDGLTDGVADSLARENALKVIGRSSTSRFSGKKPDVREVGRLLDVASVLEGSIERTADRVKVIARLDRASDGSLLWSRSYERKAGDLFAVQSELVAGIARSLNVASGRPKSRHVPKEEAFDLVLKASYDVQQMTTESLARAGTEYRHAMDLDPEYGAVYLGLGTVQYDQALARGAIHRTEAECKSAAQFFRKALELDPDLPDAHALLGIVALQYDWDWLGAEHELLSAVAGHNSPNAEAQYALFLVFRGRFAEAEAHIHRALEMSPFSNWNNLSLARDLEGRFAQAREMFQQLSSEHPEAIQPQFMIAFTHIEEGRPELAFPVLRKLRPRFPPAQMFEAMACARAGRREEALRLIRPYEEKYPDTGVSMSWISLVYAFLGDEENTVKWEERSADAHEYQALFAAVQPEFAGMRNSPRLGALLKRMGLDGVTPGR